MSAQPKDDHVQMTWPTLYRLRNGKIQTWRVWVTWVTGEAAEIMTEYGWQYGKMQRSSVAVSAGKNIGRSNETTPFQQAQLEATATWNKKLKEGYVQDHDQALKGDNGLGDVILPMLAHRYDKYGHKLVYPCLVQPKLDGHRCIARIVDGKATLQSRGGDPITQLPHIVKNLERLFAGHTITLDGELYNHDYRDKFDKLSECIRQQTEPHPNHEIVQYHVYDLVCEWPYVDRVREINGTLPLDLAAVRVPVVRVSTELANTEDDLLSLYEEALQMGYEGAMAKNTAGLYQQDKRSYDLLKLKSFEDNDYEIIGVREGKGKMAGVASTFVCKTAEGNEFDCSFNAPLDELKRLYEDHSLWLGKLLVVRHQGFTQKNKVPRIPKGLRLRVPGE